MRAWLGIVLYGAVLIPLGFYVGRDMGRRGYDKWIWGLFVVVLPVLAIPWHLVVRGVTQPGQDPSRRSRSTSKS